MSYFLTGLIIIAAGFALNANSKLHKLESALTKKGILDEGWDK